METSFSLGLQRTPLVNERECCVLCEDGLRRIFGRIISLKTKSLCAVLDRFMDLFHSPLQTSFSCYVRYRTEFLLRVELVFLCCRRGISLVDSASLTKLRALCIT